MKRDRIKTLLLAEALICALLALALWLFEGDAFSVAGFPGSAVGQGLSALAASGRFGFALAFTLSLDDFVVTNLNKGNNGVNTISTYVYANLKRNLDPAIRALSTIIFVAVLAVLIAVNVIKKKKKKA